MKLKSLLLLIIVALFGVSSVFAQLDSGTGLMIARNKKLAVELLEKALRDPNHEVYAHSVRTLVTL